MFCENLRNIELVIFDLDGTLIDSNGINNNLDFELVRFLGESKSKKKILKERDELFKSNNEGDIYLNYCEYLKAKYNSKMSKEEILQYRRSLSKELSREVELKPNADKAIEFLKRNNIKLALATVSRRETLNIYINENEHIKSKCNLEECFDYIVTKDDVILKKPNPEVYNKIIQKFKIKDFSKCVVIEDSLTGILAAKRANLKVIAIYDKYSDKDRTTINKIADYTVTDFEELIYLFKNSKKKGVLK